MDVGSDIQASEIPELSDGMLAFQIVDKKSSISVGDLISRVVMTVILNLCVCSKFCSSVCACVYVSRSRAGGMYLCGLWVCSPVWTYIRVLKIWLVSTRSLSPYT